ncbi:hypothetical protein [Streptomyces sp. NPDC016845]|uniref:hypothetical protein n=1 Tax=Streptomyces sp. NPDC016845 TaxID=3364972 RepID=UPI003791D12E
MNTATNYLTVLFVFLLLAAPSLWGAAHDRRIDREIRRARQAQEKELLARNPEYAKVA